MQLPSPLSVLALCASLVYAAPTQSIAGGLSPHSVVRQPRAVAALSSADLASFSPFTQFARAAYCEDGLDKWDCGDACKANPDFQVSLTGGDGNAVQLFFVGFSPSLGSIVVSHQGTDPTQLMSILTDLNILTGTLDEELFPGVPAGVHVHEGFRNQHAKEAVRILNEVKSLMISKKTRNIAVVGHSLGGALAELTSLFFTLNLPANTNIRAITFGTPRVGNADFASFFNAKVPNFLRINHDNDPIPIVPGRFLGFSQPEGEVHILSPGKAVSCLGIDNDTDDDCTIKTVPNLFFGNIIDHLGPYEGVFIGTPFCH